MVWGWHRNRMMGAESVDYHRAHGGQAGATGTGHRRGRLLRLPGGDTSLGGRRGRGLLGLDGEVDLAGRVPGYCSGRGGLAMTR